MSVSSQGTGLAALVLGLWLGAPVLAQGTAVAPRAETPESSIDWWNTSVWDNPNRSFQWYPPPPPPPEAAPTSAKEPEAKPKKKLKLNAKIADFKTTKEVKEHLEALKDVAVMKPTTENVTAYYAFQMQVLDQSSIFADAARRAIWTTPDLDYSTRRPTMNVATQAFKERERVQVANTSAKLSATHGLFFFFRSDCPYCHQMGPLMKDFAAKTGMQVMAISLDGGGLPDWPNAKTNNGIAENLQVQTVPAIYLFGKSKGDVQPIAFGVTPASTLMERIHVLTQTKPGQEF